jgi:hypothetical protein
MQCRGLVLAVLNFCTSITIRLVSYFVSYLVTWMLVSHLFSQDEDTGSHSWRC